MLLDSFNSYVYILNYVGEDFVWKCVIVRALLSVASLQIYFIEMRWFDDHNDFSLSFAFLTQCVADDVVVAISTPTTTKNNISSHTRGERELCGIGIELSWSLKRF